MITPTTVSPIDIIIELADAACNGFFALLGAIIAAMISYIVTKVNLRNQLKVQERQIKLERENHAEQIRARQLEAYIQKIEKYTASRNIIFLSLTRPTSKKIPLLNTLTPLTINSNDLWLSARSVSQELHNQELKDSIDIMENLYYEAWNLFFNEGDEVELQSILEKVKTLQDEIASELGNIRQSIVHQLLPKD